MVSFLNGVARAINT